MNKAKHWIGKRMRCEFRDRWEKWGGNGVKNLTELLHPFPIFTVMLIQVLTSAKSLSKKCLVLWIIIVEIFIYITAINENSRARPLSFSQYIL